MSSLTPPDIGPEAKMALLRMYTVFAMERIKLEKRLAEANMVMHTIRTEEIWLPVRELSIVESVKKGVENEIENAQGRLRLLNMCEGQLNQLKDAMIQDHANVAASASHAKSTDKQ